MSEVVAPVVEPVADALGADLIGLPGRARWLFHLRALSRLVFGWSPFTFVVGAVLASQVGWEWGVGVAAGAWVLGFLWSVWMPSLAFERWGYRVGEREVTVVNGVLVRTVSAIPLGRVQFVDVRQGLLDQLFGLATLRIHTASGLGVDAAIPGLDAAEADRLKQDLVARARGDDGV